MYTNFTEDSESPTFHSHHFPRDSDSHRENVQNSASKYSNFNLIIQNDAEPSAEEVEAQLQHDIKDDAPREIKDVEPDEESTEIEHQQLQAVSFIQIIFIISHQKYLMGNNDIYYKKLCYPYHRH